jgi:hypothetical protein
VLLLIDAGRLADHARGRPTAVRLGDPAAGSSPASRRVRRFGRDRFSRAGREGAASRARPGHLARAADLLCHARHDLDDPDSGRALRALLRGGCRRTLVVVFTELADPRAADAALKHIGALAPRHLGLAVTLADADLEAARAAVPRDADGAYQRVAAEEMWQDYRRTEQALMARGRSSRARARTRSPPRPSSAYMEIKRTGRL